MREASKKLTHDRYVFHGQLNQDQIARLLHEVQFVAVFSECFDVYPSIVLESLVHGAIPFTYPTVGNSNLVASVSPDLILEIGQSIGEFELAGIENISNLNERVNSIGKSLPTFGQAYAKYRVIFDQIVKE
jgi:hypothetical protein